jgi:plastocyanin
VIQALGSSGLSRKGGPRRGGWELNKNLLLIVTALCLSLPIYAGEVSGKTVWSGTAESTAKANKEKDKIVIWLEGKHDFKLPGPMRIFPKNLRFTPDFTVAVKGQTIELPNDDEVAHNVYSYTGLSSFNLGTYAKGQSRTVSFDKTGIVDIFCSIHNQMHARIFVVPTPYFTTGNMGGSFAIPDVPAGTYTLKVWNDRSRMVNKSIVVPPSGKLDVNIALEPVEDPKIAAAK